MLSQNMKQLLQNFLLLPVKLIKLIVCHYLDMN